jgi:hypothetical protein
MEAKHDVKELYKLENLDNLNAIVLEQAMADVATKVT